VNPAPDIETRLRVHYMTKAAELRLPPLEIGDVIEQRHPSMGMTAAEEPRRNVSVLVGCASILVVVAIGVALAASRTGNAPNGISATPANGSVPGASPSVPQTTSWSLCSAVSTLPLGDAPDRLAASYSVGADGWTFIGSERGPSVASMLWGRGDARVTVQTGPESQVVPSAAPGVAVSVIVTVFGRAVDIETDATGVSHTASWLMPSGLFTSVSMTNMSATDAAAILSSLRPLSAAQLNDLAGQPPSCPRA